jgi:hypothetical protein
MNWYKKAQQKTINVNQYLSKEEKSSIRELNKEIKQRQQTIQMYQNSIVEKQNQAQQENRPLNEREQIYIKGAEYNINEINGRIEILLNNIEEIKNRVQTELLTETNEDRKAINLINEAKKEFKTTTNILEAGYILPDGKMLDFSAKREGGLGGERPKDHRQIEVINGLERSRTDAMLEFMSATGSIRVGAYEGLDLDIAKPITPQQMTTILRNIRGKDYLTIDISDINSNTLWTKTVKMPRVDQAKRAMQGANRQF